MPHGRERTPEDSAGARERNRDRLAQSAAAAREAAVHRSLAAREAALAKSAKARAAALEKGAGARDVARERGREGRERIAQGAVAARERGRDIRRAAVNLDIPWARCGPARAAREGFLSFLLGPMIDWYTTRRTVNRESFVGLKPPVLFVANHSSHIDTPIIMLALPRKWRQRTAVGAAADYFYKNRLIATAVSLIFNTVPIERRGGGLEGGSAEHLHTILRQRWNLLLYPEGSRSRDGELHRMRSGAAVLAAQHGIPIVPVYVEGTHKAMPPGRVWPRRKLWMRRHPISVRFGPPVVPQPGEHRREITNRLQAFFDEQDARVGRDDAAAPARPAAPAAA
ncbi:MAG: lysophospholipid acyltransferase family protein [Solirubrobacteraceae bacterium]